MEVKKEARFRINIKDLKTNNIRVITIYSEKKLTVDEFKVKLVEKIKEIE